jgi:hypothetical protein
VPTVAEFRRSLIGADVLDIVDTFLLSTGAAHVSDENLKYIANSLVAANFQVTFDFINECGFERKSRIWRKADLFTVLIELYFALIQEGLRLQPSDVVANLNSFYSDIDAGSLNQGDIAGVYYKAALQASNDRLNRVRRGLIIGGIIRSVAREEIKSTLQQHGLTE